MVVLAPFLLYSFCSLSIKLTQAVGICPTGWGTTTANSEILKSEGSYEIAVIFAGQNFTCYGRVLNWKIRTDVSEKIKIGIVRPIENSADYSVISLESFFTTTGEQTLSPSINVTFMPNDSVALIAKKDLFPIYESSESLVIFHQVTFTNGETVLKEQTKQETTGTFNVYAEIEDNTQWSSWSSWSLFLSSFEECFKRRTRSCVSSGVIIPKYNCYGSSEIIANCTLEDTTTFVFLMESSVSVSTAVQVASSVIATTFAISTSVVAAPTTTVRDMFAASTTSPLIATWTTMSTSSPTVAALQSSVVASSTTTAMFMSAASATSSVILTPITTSTVATLTTNALPVTSASTASSTAAASSANTSSTSLASALNTMSITAVSTASSVVSAPGTSISSMIAASASYKSATSESSNLTTSSIIHPVKPSCVEKCGNKFTNWGECSSTCGVSNRTRFLICESDQRCEETHKEIESCPMVPCKVDGGWSSWTSWSDCSKECSGGFKTRNRTCTNPRPEQGGLNCAGISQETVGCNFEICKVHGGFSAWSQWSFCDQPCGTGREKTFRECNSPLPAFGGKDCEGEELRNRTCNAHSCKTINVTTEVRLTNETIVHSLWYKGSHEYNSFAEKLKHNIDALYENSENVIVAVILHELSENGTFNFTVIFRQSATDEIVVLKHACEDVGVLNTMPVQLVRVISSTVPEAPVISNATAISSTSILVTWTFTPPNDTTGFVIFYKKFGERTWQRKATERSKRQFVLSMLQMYSLYTIRVAASTNYSNGIPSNYVDCITLQGVPDSAPKNFSCTPSSASTLTLEWMDLNADQWNGAMRGYTVFYKEYNSKDPLKIAITPNIPTYITLEGLQPFTRYELYMAAFTDAGYGPLSWQQCRTDEDVPKRAPNNLTATLLSRDGTILVTWDIMQKNDTGGVPIGYTVYYKETRRGNVENAIKVEKAVVVSQYTNQAILSGFQSYTEVEIKVSASTVAGEGPKSEPIYVETCRCPKSVYVSWYPNAPLIFGDADNPEGFLADFIRNCTSEICQVCDGSSDHSLGEVKLFFNKTKDGRRCVFESEEKLKSKVAGNAHIFLPINGRQDVDVFQKDYKFLMVVQSAGSVLLTTNQKSTAGDKIAQIALSCWPPMTIVVLLTLVFGTLVWFADRRQNPEEFSLGSFIRGSLSGFWWGIITMTTVGYGDFTPKSNPARLIAMIWMLIGPILSSILIGAISTSMTSMQVKEDVMLYGTSVAVKANSTEYFLAIRRNAKLKAENILQNSSDVIEALTRGKVKAALVDSLSAARFQNIINAEKLVVAKTYSQIDGYGMVLSSDFIPLEENLRSYLDANQNFVAEFRTEYEGTFKENAVEKDADSESLFSSKNSVFQNTIIVSMVLIVVIVALKFLVRFLGRLLKRKKVASTGSAAAIGVENFETEMSEFYVESLAKIEQKLGEVERKQQKDVFHWFTFNKHMVGVPIWLKVRMLEQQNRVSKIKKLRAMQLESGWSNYSDRGVASGGAFLELSNVPTSNISEDVRVMECFPKRASEDK